MLSYQIKDTKKFMQNLLVLESFDHFLLEEASITTFNTFHIDGRIMKEFYSKEEIEELPEKNLEFSSWQALRPICFQLIKGKRTPLRFQFVFHLSPADADKLLSLPECTVSKEYLKSFVLNIRFDGTHLTCITATALNTFIPDKSADQIWDENISHFLAHLQLSFETE